MHVINISSVYQNTMHLSINVGLLLIVINVFILTANSEDVPTETKVLEKEKSKPDPFGIMSLASRVGRAAFEDYSIESEKDTSSEHKEGFKRKESDWKKDDELNKSLTVEKTVRKKEHSQGDTRTRSSSSARETTHGDRRNQENGREDQRGSGRRVETNRKKSIEEDRRHSEEAHTSHSSDRRQYSDDNRTRSNDNRRDRVGSSQSRGNKRRRGQNSNNKPRNEARRGRLIHRIVVTNKVICPNCTHCSPPHTPSTPVHHQSTNPYYYY